jgi:prevent-host-death family protein
MSARNKDVRPLTDFKRNTSGYLTRMKRTRRPVVLTVHGKAELVVQDAQSYQELLDALDRAQAVQGIRLGLEQANRGEGIPARQVLAEIRQVLGLRP